MNVNAVERLTLEDALRKAQKRNEFVFYQPQLNIQTGEIIGMEGLLRWHHPKLGWVPCEKFSPIAEDAGMIETIGEWVLRTACAQTKDWHDAGYALLRVSVNLSSRQFQQASLTKVVAQALEAADLAAEYLELELTESMSMQNVEITIATLRELKRMGVILSVDDFGTGYFSLSYLKEFPLDVLKIDQSSVRDIVTTPTMLPSSKRSLRW